LDENGVTQQYYIATRSTPTDDRSRVLKYGTMFAVFDRLGDMEPLGLGEQGIFFEGTRFLSAWLLSIYDERPFLLSSTIKSGNFIFTADLTNVDFDTDQGTRLSRGTVHLLRSRFLWQGVCYEEIRVSNYGLSSIGVPLRLTFDADFADLFEVRGTHRERRGQRLPDKVESDSVTLSYEGLDHRIRQTRIECNPTPNYLSSSEIRFELSLPPKDSATLRLATFCDQNVSHRSIGYERARSAAESELKAASAATCKIFSSNERFNRWVQRSLGDVEMMTLGNPEVNYPYAGVPWFSTVFGRDGIITAMEMLWVAPWLAKGVLQFLAETQATEMNSAIEAEPGKILHEMRGGEMANLGEVPFGRYYGTVDATPLFIMLAGAYQDYVGDREFLRDLWPHIDLALQWMDRYGDVDNDGFVEYIRHGDKGLVQQGWKDSNDSIFHADGSIADPPIALCEVQGYVYAAKLAAAKMCRTLGDDARADELEQGASDLQRKFEDAFWCRDLSTYAIALDGRKRPCRVRTSNAGHTLFSGIAGIEKARLVAHTLLGHDFFTGWGVRTVGSQECRYNPLSYHNGSIWPHDNAIIASGLARYGFRDLAGQILLGLLDVSAAVELQRLPELFCGLDRRTGEGPTLYPVACSPQAWAAASVFMLLQACLGISIDGRAKRLTFERPYLPKGIPRLWIRSLPVGNERVDLFLERTAGTVRVDVLEKQGQLEVIEK